MEIVLWFTSVLMTRGERIADTESEDTGSNWNLPGGLAGMLEPGFCFQESMDNNISHSWLVIRITCYWSGRCLSSSRGLKGIQGGDLGTGHGILRGMQFTVTYCKI